MFPKVNSVCLLAVCIVAVSLSGCRNHCSQPCGTPFQQQAFPGFQQQNFQQQFPNFQQPGFQQNFQQPTFQQSSPVFSGSTSRNSQPLNNTGFRSPIIPPPATGTLNIPSLARNNPFGLNPNGGLLNTQQRAPTPASDRSARFNLQNGWQPVDGRSTRPLTNQSNTTQPANNTTLGSTPAAGSGAGNDASNARSVLVQDTQSRTNRGYGDSFIRSPDYATTAANDTFDRTRLPATDASGVRAPSQYYARASGVQVAQTQLPGQGLVGVQQQPNYYQGTFQAQNPAAYNVAAGVNQQFVANPAGVLASRSNVIVQDQSTATYDPYGNTRSADWRNRDSSGSFQ